jgi:hypothetical protein
MIPTTHNNRTTARRIQPSIFLGAAILLAAIGCQPPLDTTYVYPSRQSINGINVFVDSLKQSGWVVDRWRGVSHQMEDKYGAVIIFLQKWDEIPSTERYEIQSLLVGGKIRDVFIVVRDSDAAVEYWRQIEAAGVGTAEEKQTASREYLNEIERLNREAQKEFEAKRGILYGLKLVDRSKDGPDRAIESYVDESKVIKARWPLNRRLVPSDDAEILWSAGDDPLLIREDYGQGSIIVLASATPLLNGSLVDSGNRELVAEFVKLLPEGERIAIAMSETLIDGFSDEQTGMLKWIKVHPNGWIFGQAIFAIVLFCAWKFPIFGRPRVIVDTETVRFGKHVEAVARLFKRAGNDDFAWERILEWKRKERVPHQDPDAATVNPNGLHQSDEPANDQSDSNTEVQSL